MSQIYSAMCWRCGCCTACRPRYKRLVDAIYPAVPTDGLSKADMQKLTFYAVSHPEKLDRIGEYLAGRLGRDVARGRTPLIHVSAAAMDQLLSACHGSPSLNLFVESFLKMVQKLLETGSPELELTATDSFVAFSNIQEDTPGYHRRYDFFISKFSQLCHYADKEAERRRRLRLAGLKGLRGVVRKTVGDDLQANIWELDHMHKIVPSILYNFHDRDYQDAPEDEPEVRDAADGADGGDSTDVASPRLLADTCLRELIGKASFGCMKNVLTAVLSHCDLHSLWVPHAYAVRIFSAIVYSIQSQYSYVVIQSLIGHLDQHGSAEGDTRVGIAAVLCATVRSASAGIGPSLLEIFNSLLRHLRSSVDYEKAPDCPSPTTELRYQETLINTMGDFADSLPDYQKVEMMMFVIGKVPAAATNSDSFLQYVLMRTLLKVATKYKTGYLSTAMPMTFLEPLLRFSVGTSPGVRLLVQEILHTLFDRHANLPSLHSLRRQLTPSPELRVEKCSRFDQMFMKKAGERLMSSVFRAALLSDNSADSFHGLLLTLCLMVVEVGSDDVVVGLFRLALGLQTAALEPSTETSLSSRLGVHNLVARFLSLASQLLSIPALSHHVDGVIEARARSAHPALNLLRVEGAVEEAAEAAPETLEELRLEEDSLFAREAISMALESSARDVKALNVPFSVSGLEGGGSPSRGSPSLDNTSHGSDSVDGEAGDSRRPSHAGLRRGTLPGLDMGPSKPLTVSQVRDWLGKGLEYWDEAEEEAALELRREFRRRPVWELAAERKAQASDLRANVRGILQRHADNHKDDLPKAKPKDIFELQLPSLFVH